MKGMGTMIACEVLWWSDGTYRGSKVYLGNDGSSHLVLTKAESFFKEKVRELTGELIPDSDLDDDLEKGFFHESSRDIEVIITYPEIEAVS